MGIYTLHSPRTCARHYRGNVSRVTPHSLLHLIIKLEVYPATLPSGSPFCFRFVETVKQSEQVKVYLKITKIKMMISNISDKMVD
jgi:hypothetical protein